ncbi:MAG: hypothetical protein AAGC56_11550 [Pseudomonadota bacterium]
MIKNALCGSAAALVLASCGTVGGGDNRYEPTGTGRGFITAAPLSLDNNPLNKIDLLSMIDPENRRVALKSAGLCAAHNARPATVAADLDDINARRRLRDLEGELDDAYSRRRGLRNDNAETSTLTEYIEQLEGEVRSLKNRQLATTDNSLQTIEELRKKYIVNRYSQITF